MQPLKKVLSWISGIALVIGAAIEALQSAGIVFDPASPIGKFVMLAGVVVLVARNLTADKDGDGIPDILQPGDRAQARRGVATLGVLVLLVAAGLVLAACGGAAAPSVAVQPLAAPSDTIAYRLVAHPQAGSQVTAARWKITADNVPAGSFADALEAVVVWAKPAPLACVNFKAIAWAVRADRQTGVLRLSRDSTVKAWQRCEGDTDPPALDSVSVVELTLPAS